jgi:transcriptional regulator with XRE-family HTH domain
VSRLDELGQFLKSRRAALRPADAGLPHDAKRRVSGLRREEVAVLAGLSVDYYVRLEQGRAARPSRQVLDAVARALHLDEVERAHLDRLAEPTGRGGRPAPDRAGIRPALRAVLDTMPGAAAYVLDASMDVLAGNELAGRVFSFDPSGQLVPGHNVARAVFTAPAARTFWSDWDQVARDCVAFLRLSLGQRRGDARLHTVVGELCVASTDFTRLWAQQHVRQKTRGAKTITHPLVGRIGLEYETFLLPDDTGQALIVYVATDQPSTDALQILLNT